MLSVSTQPLYSAQSDIINASVGVNSDAIIPDPLGAFTSLNIRYLAESSLKIKSGAYNIIELALTGSTDSGLNAFYYSYYVRWARVGSQLVVNNIEGIQGSPGSIGPLGPQGPIGIRGLQGVEGPTGPSMGPPGTQGATGAQGYVGPEGPAGQLGDTGPAGPQGNRGVQGSRGE